MFIKAFNWESNEGENAIEIYLNLRPNLINMETKLEQKILEKLDKIEKEVEGIREHMVDIDSILTQEEEARYEESLKEYHAGKAVSLEDFEKKRRK